MRRIVLLCLVFLCSITSTSLAQVKVGEKGELNTLFFGDYYWMASNHNSDLEGNNGFWFRRIYFTYDHDISDSFSARLRLEMNSAGDFITNSKLTPVVKDAYLRWENDKHQILAGISSVPALGLVEDVWEYRSIEKTPLDLHDFASSRDFGLSVKGELDGGGKLNYHFMFANGSSNATELNKGKKFMLSVSYELTEHLIIEGYGDWNDNPNGREVVTAQGFIAYLKEKIKVGALYAHQLRQNVMLAGAPIDLNLDLASVFSNFTITGKAQGFLRVDHLFDRNPNGGGIDYIPFSDQAESTFLVGGVDLKLDPKVHLMPNIETVVYGETITGNTPDADIIPRLTLFVKL